MNAGTLLCYGDSNTWGFTPGSGARHPREVRWPGVLAGCLGEGVRLIEEGLNGRTVCTFFPEGDPLNGAEHLPGCLRAYREVDTLVLLLGINDLFCDPSLQAAQVASTLEGALALLPSSCRVVLLPPLPVNLRHAPAGLYEREAGAARELAAEYRRLAQRRGCLFWDPGEVIEASALDGVHIDAESHLRLGRALCGFLKGQLPPGQRSRSDPPG